MQTNKSNPTTSLGRAFRMVESSSIVALDLETSGLNPRCSRIRLIQISNGEETYVIDCWRNPAAGIRFLVKVLADVETLLAHGADFEWRFIYHHYGVELNNLKDTMLMARLLSEGDMSVPCGLGAIVKR